MGDSVWNQGKLCEGYQKPVLSVIEGLSLFLSAVERVVNIDGNGKHGS